MSITTETRTAAYARQRGIAAALTVKIPEDTTENVASLLAKAKAIGVEGVNTKTRKGALIDALNASAPAVSLDSLTDRQRRRVNKKARKAA